MIFTFYFLVLFEWEFMEKKDDVEVNPGKKKTYKAENAAYHWMWDLKDNSQGVQIFHATDHH